VRQKKIKQCQYKSIYNSISHKYPFRIENNADKSYHNLGRHSFVPLSQFSSVSEANKNLMSDPTIRLPGFNLGRSTWSVLNRFGTVQGRCAANLHKWHTTSSDKCQCGDLQTMSHIVESCPLFDGDLLRLLWAAWCALTCGMSQQTHSRIEGEVGFTYLVAAEPPNYPLATTLEMTIIPREPHKMAIPRNCKDVFFFFFSYACHLP